MCIYRPVNQWPKNWFRLLGIQDASTKVESQNQSSNQHLWMIKVSILISRAVTSHNISINSGLQTQMRLLSSGFHHIKYWWNPSNDPKPICRSEGWFQIRELLHWLCFHFMKCCISSRIVKGEFWSRSTGCNMIHLSLSQFIGILREHTGSV